MCPSYCRIRTPMDEAIRRFAVWKQIPESVQPLRLNWRDAFRQAVDDRGAWKGNAVFVSDLSEWTLFENLSGCLGGIPASDWLRFAEQDELVVAGYNDSICYGELVVIKDGMLRRAFLSDESDPKADTDIGRLDCEYEPFKSWVEVASSVDADELGLSKDEGWLWVY